MHHIHIRSLEPSDAIVLEQGDQRIYDPFECVGSFCDMTNGSRYDSLHLLTTSSLYSGGLDEQFSSDIYT